MEYKLCKCCSTEKHRSEFRVRKDAASGLTAHCKKCLREKSRKYYKNNREAVLERTSKYQKENREVSRKAQKKYREAHRAELNARALKHYHENKDSILSEIKRKTKEDPEFRERCQERQKRYMESDLGKRTRRKCYLDWTAKNKHKVCFYAANRRAKIKQATPSWADMDIIESFYLEARYFGMHVDHIIPLTSDLVCGLHCEFNLQLLPSSDNQSKHNKFEIQEHTVPEFF